LVQPPPEYEAARHDGAGSTEAGTQSGAESPPAGRGVGIAYAFVNKRERTEAEVRERLQRAEIQSDEIEMAVAELFEFGFLDDARYARVFTEDKRNLEAWGNERIARALRERGVERGLIESALAQTELAEDGELDRAIALLGQRFPSGPAEARNRERAFGVLARKGYESETASDAVREWARKTAA
jgi:regulatory protein